MHVLLYSPFKFQVLPMPDSDYKHHGGQGLRNGTVFGLDLEEQLCVNTPQNFTIDGSSTGEPPETVAVVTPDGENVIVLFVLLGVSYSFKQYNLTKCCTLQAKSCY